VIFLAALGVSAALAMNLMVQFGLGLGILAAGEAGLFNGSPRDQRRACLLGVLIFTLALFFLWFFFSYILAPLGPGFYWYLLLYPLCASLLKGLEALYKKFLPGSKTLGLFFSFPGGYAEFLPLGLLIVLNLSVAPLEALFLSLSLSLGLYLSLEILREIRRRSALEAVPLFLRNTPLSLISLGLLSLIFSSASLMFFNLFRVGRIG
jgi:electron transport complex protein RnfA